jgi:hypothetical protein
VLRKPLADATLLIIAIAIQRGAAGNHLHQSAVDLHAAAAGRHISGVWQSFVTSWRLARWRSSRVLGLVVVVTFLAGMAAFMLGAVTLTPTIAADILAPATSPWFAAFGLSVWQIGIFVIAALLTIMIDDEQQMRD